MLAKMQKVARINLKLYKDFLFYIQEKSQKYFEELFVYSVKYDGEDEDFVCYHIEVPISLLREATHIIEDAIDIWVKRYKEEQKEEKKVSEDEYIWE